MVEGAPAGLSEDFPDLGIFPPVMDKADAEDLDSLSRDVDDFSNSASVEHCKIAHD